MTDKAVQYYIDKEKELGICIDRDSVNGGLYISIYNDRIDSSIGFSCNIEELQQLAEFFNRVCQVNNVIKKDIRQ